MKQLILILTLCAGTLTGASAQTFTKRIQQKVDGMGTVTIHESDSIDLLVNTATLGSTTAKPATTNRTTTTTNGTTTNGTTTTTTPSNGTNATMPNTAANGGQTTEREEPLPVDTSKKMLVGGYKVNGYRVQAFAGGNSRKDRQQAEQTGNNIKASFPDVPVYVHFYSPRWICRVGNYRTYEEAHQMLVSLRKMGFTQATIVKGKITVTD